MNKVDDEHIVDLIRNYGLTIEQVIDIVIQENGFIGVGLISLGDSLQSYCYKHKGYIHDSTRKTKPTSE